MGFSRWKNFFVVLIMMTILTSGVSFALQDKNYLTDQVAAISNNVAATLNVATGTLSVPQKLSNPPEIIKAVYVTGYSAGTKKYLNYLSNLFKTTEINAVVIDIKDYSGLVSYNSGAPAAKKYNLYNNAIGDIDALVRFFHNQNIYVIGRIAVFEDPAYSKARPELAIYNKTKTTDSSQPVLWQDNNKLSWLNPASKDVWDYNISLAKDVFSHGFDEVNFDYVRFPSDGKIGNMGFPIWDGKTPKAEIIKDFFNYTRQQLADEKISVDLFGQTTTNTDDMGIGQIIENAFENFDYVSPMVYPSHYIDGFMGFSNPAEHPYEVIKYSMDSAINREKIFSAQEQGLTTKNTGTQKSSTTNLQSPAPVPIMVPLAKFRPWLQDFNMGADYTADMVKQEIQATQDALGNDFSGFMLWNPSNIYTEEAILKPS
jgi:hypothetical protein